MSCLGKLAVRVVDGVLGRPPHVVAKHLDLPPVLDRPAEGLAHLGP
jgi:hypothetical protein